MGSDESGAACQSNSKHGSACKQAGRSAQHEAFQAHRQILLVAEWIVDVAQRTAVRKSLFAQRKSERVTQQAVWNGRKLAVGKRARKAL